MSGSVTSQILTNAVSTATAMLEFSMQKGLALDLRYIAAITAARRSDTVLTGAEEAEFWIAYAALAARIKPATAESVLATKGSARTNAAMRTASMYRRRTIITMILLLASQVYWLIGATVIADLREIRPRLEVLSEQGMKLSRDQAALNNLLPAKTDKTYAAKAAEPEHLRKQQQIDAESDTWNARLEIEKISAATDFQVLRNWNIFHNLLISKVPAVPRDASPTSTGNQPTEIGSDEFFLWVFSLENLTQLRTSEIVLTALIKYILPILFGALGASAYIVRVLADEIADSTYTDSARIRFQLRFYLGAVAGFSIAWFTSSASLTDAPGVLQSLSPLAVAFLAGYSVELLFSLLDRLVLAFSNPKPTPVATTTTTTLSTSFLPAAAGAAD